MWVPIQVYMCLYECRGQYGRQIPLWNLEIFLYFSVGKYVYLYMIYTINFTFWFFKTVIEHDYSLLLNFS